jgi:hypothetical protein
MNAMLEMFADFNKNLSKAQPTSNAHHLVDMNCSSNNTVLYEDELEMKPMDITILQQNRCDNCGKSFKFR